MIKKSILAGAALFVGVSCIQSADIEFTVRVNDAEFADTLSETATCSRQVEDTALSYSVDFVSADEDAISINCKVYQMSNDGEQLIAETEGARLLRGQDNILSIVDIAEIDGVNTFEMSFHVPALDDIDTQADCNLE